MPGSSLSRTTVALLCVLSIAVPAVGQLLQAEGKAYKPGTSQLLYIERYSELANDQVQVRYEDVQGEALATKALDFSSDAFAPDMDNEDLRLGSRLQISVNSTGITIDSSGGEKKAFKATLDPVEKLVIDAGFDAYVRDHWDSLVDGKRHSIRFLVPARKTTVKLRVQQRECPARSELALVTSDPRRCFRIKAANWLVAAAMKSIDLEYSEKSRRLRRFTGLGQLPDSRGKGQRIDLHYQYLQNAKLKQ